MIMIAICFNTPNDPIVAIFQLYYENSHETTAKITIISKINNETVQIYVTGYEKRAHFGHYVNCQYRAKSANRIYFRRISIIASYVSTMFTLSSCPVSDQDSFPRLRTRPKHLNMSRMLSVHGVDRKCNTDVIR